MEEEIEVSSVVGLSISGDLTPRLARQAILYGTINQAKSFAENARVEHPEAHVVEVKIGDQEMTANEAKIWLELD